MKDSLYPTLLEEVQMDKNMIVAVQRKEIRLKASGRIKRNWRFHGPDYL